LEEGFSIMLVLDGIFIFLLCWVGVYGVYSAGEWLCIYRFGSSGAATAEVYFSWSR
jgi:hypothetical protein